ncbi:hypothetical protein C7S18_03600 [Ahniella affigens]|uniref:Methyltransferase type 11 domain-containing protein n=1 Tax=Ahniella affigens TaxID=2021234 RepID=A0A2P1PNC0_9GAMM|nr:hypothetical protein [Ahniella affigens]AVP96329.1 hypothetical protein C7S18_03600 [Ahniella affigens]
MAEPHPLPDLSHLCTREQRVLGEALAVHDRVLWLAAGQQPEANPACLALRLGEHNTIEGDLCAAIDAWPIRDRSMDQVILQHSLDFSPLGAVVIGEALRVLKPERELWITGLGRLGWQRWRMSWQAGRGHRPHPPSLNQLRLLLMSHGCVDLQVQCFQNDALAGSASMFSDHYLLRARKREIRPMATTHRRVRVLKSRAGVWSPSARNLRELDADWSGRDPSRLVA